MGDDRGNLACSWFSCLLRTYLLDYIISKALRSAGGIRHPLRMLRKEKIVCSGQREDPHAWL